MAVRTLALTLVVTLSCAGVRQSTRETPMGFEYRGSSVERLSESATTVTVAIGTSVLAFEHAADGRHFTKELPYRTFDSWQGAARAIIDMNQVVPETAAR